ncbi:MAG: cupin domain-containing protein [Gemmatimonadota bacterium]|nr:cupin domain-containing protein [Gemmatimonadota bacterium]
MTSLTVSGIISGWLARARCLHGGRLVSTLGLMLALSAPQGSGAQAPLHSWVFPADSARSRKSSETSSVRSLVDTLTKTLAKLEMHETTLAPGASPHAAHRHAHEEFIIIKTGLIEVLQGTVTRMAGPGSVAFMASNEWHGFRNVGAVPASYLVVRFDPHDMPPDSASVGRAPAAVPSAPASVKP